MSESKEGENESTVPASTGEQKQPLTRQKRIERWFEVITALMLGVVALATAWSGYHIRQLAGKVNRQQSTLMLALCEMNQPFTRRRPGRSRCTTPASSTNG